MADAQSKSFDDALDEATGVAPKRKTPEEMKQDPTAMLEDEGQTLDDQQRKLDDTWEVAESTPGSNASEGCGSNKWGITDNGSR